jgi:hypothetical protein
MSHPETATPPTPAAARPERTPKVQPVTGPETFTFLVTVDQAPIFVRKWLPPSGTPLRAAVQITHGIAEHP